MFFFIFLACNFLATKCFCKRDRVGVNVEALFGSKSFYDLLGHLLHTEHYSGVRQPDESMRSSIQTHSIAWEVTI